MNSIAICSQKGGVGKTTVALNLAYAFARRGRSTLLVDADAQGSIGLSLRGSSPTAAGLAELVRDGSSLERVAIRTRMENFSILPAGRLTDEECLDWDARLSDGRALERLFSQAAGTYELVVVDTPSGPSGPTIGVLRHVRYALVPLQAEPLALRSMPRILNLIGTLREQGSAVELLGVVLTMLQRQLGGSLDVAEEAWQKLPANLVLETTVPRDALFVEASVRGVPLGLLRTRPPALASIFDQMAGELEQRMGLQGVEDEREPVSLLG